MNLDDYEDEKKADTKAYDRYTSKTITTVGSSYTPVGKQYYNTNGVSPIITEGLQMKSVCLAKNQ